MPQLGRWKDATSEKADRILGWKPRSREDAIVAGRRVVGEVGRGQEVILPAYSYFIHSTVLLVVSEAHRRLVILSYFLRKHTVYWAVWNRELLLHNINWLEAIAGMLDVTANVVPLTLQLKNLGEAAARSGNLVTTNLILLLMYINLSFAIRFLSLTVLYSPTFLEVETHRGLDHLISC